MADDMQGSRMINTSEAFAKYLDAEKMKQLFQQDFPSLKNWLLNECVIQHPRFKTYLNPKSHDKSFFAAAYHLNTINKLSRKAELKIIYIKAYLANRSNQVYESAYLQSDITELDNVIHIPQHDMVAWLFPYDPILTWLPKLLDKENICRYFTRLLLASSEECSGVATRIETSIVNYRPEIRCTCRHEIAKLSKRVVSIYSKTYADQHGREVFQRMVNLHQHSLNHPNSFAVAKPLGYEEVLLTVWMEGLSGKLFIDALDEINADILLPRLAYALADFHTVKMTHLAVIDEDDLLKEISKKSEKLSKAFPKWGERLQSLLLSLQMKTASLSGCPACLIHGDFHILQLLLLDDHRIALFDYDELALGCPLIDIANFCADLHSQPLAKTLTTSLTIKFFEAYINFSAIELNVAQFKWHLQVQLLTRAYRAYIQQKPDLENIVDKFLTLAESEN